MTAPTSLQIELAGIGDKLDNKEDVDLEVLSIKTRLAKVANELKKYEMWKRSHPDEYNDMDNVINGFLNKIEKLTNQKKIKDMEENVENMKKELNNALQDFKQEKIRTLERYLINSKIEVENLNKESLNEEYLNLATEIINNIEALKTRIHNFYFKLLNNVEMCIPKFEDIISNSTFTRYEINFTKMHSLIDACILHLKNVETQDHRSSITAKKKELLKNLEGVRTKFNEKIYDNENNSVTAGEFDELISKSIREIQEILEDTSEV